MKAIDDSLRAIKHNDYFEKIVNERPRCTVLSLCCSYRI